VKEKPKWQRFSDLKAYKHKNEATAQLLIIEMHLLFIYEGGIQKIDLEDPLGGWMNVAGSEKVVSPRFLIPLTDQSFIIPRTDDGTGAVFKVHVGSNEELRDG